jgi:pyruvate/oxaloacetate carboxyltransferase
VLWNPDYDAQKEMNEFLVGYYGNAFAPIREYIDMLHNKMREDNIHMTIRAKPDSEFLAPEIIQRANELFDEAERLADDEEVLHRVRVARLPIQYVQISTLPKDDPKRQKLIDRFFEVVDKAGITNISEGRSMQQYREMLKGE